MSDRDPLRAVRRAVRSESKDQRGDVRQPTLDEIRRWPATVDVSKGGSAFGLRRSTSYEAVKTGQFPAKVITVGSRLRVVTASIIRALSDEEKVA